MHPDVIVFDFDLTLADSTRAFVACHAHAASVIGLPAPDVTAVRRSIGTPLPLAFVRLYGPGHDDALIADYIRHYQAHADAVMSELTSMLPGAAAALHELASAGLRLGIVTQKLTYRVEDVLRREGLRKLFGAVIGDPELPAFKPDPSGLLLAIERLGATTTTTLYVGDTVIDAETARRADVEFVAVLSGETTRVEFAVYEPLTALASVVDLPSLLAPDPAPETKIGA